MFCTVKHQSNQIKSNQIKYIKKSGFEDVLMYTTQVLELQGLVLGD